MVLEARELQFRKLLTGDDGFNDSATLSLLPPSQVSSSQLEVPPERPLTHAAPLVNGARPKHQLTIFYAGCVNVYDDIPEDKAHAIMLLAGNSATGNASQILGSLASLQAPAANHAGFPEPAHKVRKLQQGLAAPSQAGLLLSLNFGGRASGGNFNPGIPKISCPPVPAQVLPQARKASLTRFLQRRKERVLQQSMESVKDDKTSSEFSVKNQDCASAQEENSALKKENSVGSIEA
ncbi:hypothetical protein SELMODRAFT_415314 [Selaginella moellendorffii]|uniref:Tify domain-containing protein n=1 Tax=Selaginella moellendorffii TaxID=88036 RepID=D8RVQ2_SELML|nr:protein TIFY 6B [Selaginella moellendorffii]XP_024535655.1 protein TIFY 6B [Selaginella moellendorffii]EFJ23816.1 hypothetical protein SELMODRAFT_415314 [Selaginella moellendorffii]|eukprot:XP_002975031.1 protein TIFY 6B [Selaginella moellendorffii]